MEHDIKFYFVALILTVLAIASVMTLNVILILSSIIIAMLLVGYYKLSYIVEAVIFKRTNLIQVIEGYELSGERSTAIKRVSGRFNAITAALLESTSNGSVEREKIENVISNVHCTFRFVIQVERIDTNKLLDGLRTKRSMKEIELTKLNNTPFKNNALKSNSLKRQIDQIDHEIEKISSGGTPLEVSQYIVTGATSDNRFNAQELAKSQLRELTSSFNALLGTKAEPLSGDDLLGFLKFNSMV